MDDIALREASINDLAFLVKARLDYSEAENWNSVPGTEKILDTNLVNYVTEHLGHDFFAFLCEKNGMIVSTAYLVIVSRPPNPNTLSGKHGLVQNVFTYAEFRNRGYAAQVMQMLIKKACALGLTHLELTSSKDGKKLYENLGFIFYSHSGSIPMRLTLNNGGKT